MAMLKLLSLCFVAYLVEICQAQCDVEEGARATYTCSFKQNVNATTKLQWMLTVGSNETVISECDISGSCINKYAPSLIANITNNTTSSLTFVKASRTLGLSFIYPTNLYCKLPPSTTYRACYSLNVYAKPKKVSCTLQSLNGVPNKVNCSFENIYPEAYCQPQISSNNITFVYSDNIRNYTQSRRNETPIYYNQTCQMFMNDRFFIGKNYFKVSVQPKTYNNYRYVVDGQTYTFTTAFDQGTTTKSSITTTTVATSNISTSNISASNTNLEIGLGVATAVFGTIAVTLAILMLCYWLKLKKETPQKVVKPKPVIPPSYNRVDSTQLDQGVDPDNVYEEVSNRIGVSAGANTKSVHQEQGTYVNARELANIKDK